MNKKICGIFSIILACVIETPTNAAVKVKNNNRSYADAYNQVVAVREQAAYMNSNTPYATTASATENLPVAVDDKNLADSILNNKSTDVSRADLDACSMIYPGGIFRWGVAESGVRRSNDSTCISVIELRDVNNRVLATTTVAAGDTIKCNVDYFPAHGMSSDLRNGKIEVPADEPPTLKDVEAVMNEEQKQNAGIKIAAGTIIAGLAGNMLSPKEAGDTKLLGTGKSQIAGTLVAGGIGASVMAASSYSGKVAGDTIKSTAVNAASGMAVGNMMAGVSGSGSAIKIKKCSVDGVEKDCVYGKLQKKDAAELVNANETYFIDKSGTTYKCDGEYAKCVPVQKPVAIILDGNVDFATVDFDKNQTLEDTTEQCTWSDTEYKMTECKKGHTRTGTFYKIMSAKKATSSRSAYAVFDHIPAKFGGYSYSDFNKSSVFSNPMYYVRNSNGSVGSCLYNCYGTNSTSETKDDYQFEPMNENATDGDVVDLSNQARIKGTLVGAGAGGAMGALSGYQGAKSEIEQRWTDAIRVYNDSLTNFYCATGTRYLSQYNDYLEIPRLQQSEQ